MTKLPLFPVKGYWKMDGPTETVNRIPLALRWKVTPNACRSGLKKESGRIGDRIYELWLELTINQPLYPFTSKNKSAVLSEKQFPWNQVKGP